MGRPLSQRSLEVIKACQEHLLLDGAKDYTSLMQKFPDVSRSTFFRLMEHARQNIEAGAIAHDSPEALRDAQAKIRRKVVTPETITKKIKMHLPTAPSPAIVASMDPMVSRNLFDFMAYFYRVVNDAELMRDKSVRDETDQATGDKREVLSNPVLMDNSIRRRLQIMDTYLKSMEQLYNVEKLQELFSLVIDEVGKADTNVQQAILARLRMLNDAKGLNIGARL